jgi:hypothetical protein
MASLSIAANDFFDTGRPSGLRLLPGSNAMVMTP